LASAASRRFVISISKRLACRGRLENLSASVALGIFASCSAFFLRFISAAARSSASSLLELVCRSSGFTPI
jgi:hypothetical protein